MAIGKTNYNKEKLTDLYCANCGGVIIVRNKKARFCSDNCRIVKWRERQKERGNKKRKGGKK